MGGRGVDTPMHIMSGALENYIMYNTQNEIFPHKDKLKHNTPKTKFFYNWCHKPKGN